eukprot:TRINITY_DN670_c1_g1_i2.p1 TRINITY_DN670_c1_g1~~TRINITY_DN670_c1_g1_i2.p1  ORF type:complete len:562 (-),score=34.56 TRINITY_DN670_c1_g1_i2:385-2070(-)
MSGAKTYSQNSVLDVLYCDCDNSIGQAPELLITDQELESILQKFEQENEEGVEDQTATSSPKPTPSSTPTPNPNFTTPSQTSVPNFAPPTPSPVTGSYPYISPFMTMQTQQTIPMTMNQMRFQYFNNQFHHCGQKQYFMQKQKQQLQQFTPENCQGFCRSLSFPALYYRGNINQRQSLKQIASSSDIAAPDSVPTPQLAQKINQNMHQQNSSVMPLSPMSASPESQIQSEEQPKRVQKKKVGKSPLSHSRIEKQRRDRINLLIDELRDLVPPQQFPSENLNMSLQDVANSRPKHVVLNDTIDWVKAMQNKLEQLKNKSDCKVQTIEGESVSEGGQEEDVFLSSSKDRGSPQPFGTRAKQCFNHDNIDSNDVVNNEPQVYIEKLFNEPREKPSESQIFCETPFTERNNNNDRINESNVRVEQQIFLCLDNNCNNTSGRGASNLNENNNFGVFVETLSTEPQQFKVQVRCKDRSGLLFDIVQGLQYVPLEIKSGSLTTDSNSGIVRNIFEVCGVNGYGLSQDYVQQCVFRSVFMNSHECPRNSKRCRTEVFESGSTDFAKLNF